jgi:hypothetical protein
LQSEDYFFCRMCEQINIPIYADTKVVVGHKGWCVYPLKPHNLVPALTASLRSFRDLPEHEKVTPEMMTALSQAFATFQQMNGNLMPEVKSEAKELEFEVAYKSPTEPEPSSAYVANVKRMYPLNEGVEFTEPLTTAPKKPKKHKKNINVTA